MSDDEIREILRERKRQERALQRKEDIKENIKDLVAWICWAGLGYMMFVFGQIFA